MLVAMSRLARPSNVLAVVCALVLSPACRDGSDGHAAPPAVAAPVPTTLVPPAQPRAPSAPAAEPGAPPEIARPYDETADAAAAIDVALAAARADHKNVLIVFGANWCPWCRRLEHTFTQNAAVAAELARDFHVVRVDTGARGTGKNAEVAARYGDPTRLGLPVLVVLSPDGRLKATQETGALEIGDRHDPAAILAFFTRVRS